MGKKVKILDTVIEQTGSDTTDTKDNSIMDYLVNQSSPLTREQSSYDQVRQGFQGDSQYDNNLGYGVNQNKLRARNQPLRDQLGNSLIRLGPAIALDVLETAGDLIELFDQDADKDYTNAVTELAKAGKKHLEEDFLGSGFKTYQETPANQFASLTDSGWWVNWGDGLVTSIASFGLTGAGIGGALGKGAKILNGIIKGGEFGLKIGQGVAQLATAGGLTHSEAVRSGADIYKNIKDDILQNGYDYGDGNRVTVDETEAKRIASIGASETYRDSFYSNIALNITSLNPLFKSYGKLDESVKSGLNRKVFANGVKESIPNYVKRLDELEKLVPKQAGGLKRLLAESGQEYLEETNTLVAEKLGYNAVDNTKHKKNASDIYLNTLISEEGLITGITGAIGGLGQTAGLEYIPYKTYEDENGKTQRISSINLEHKENIKYHKETISTLKTDIDYIQRKQEALNKAVESGDKTAIELARQDLFNVGMLKSMRTETVNELSEVVAGLAQVDNIKILKNSKTSAQNQGLSDNIDDNKYKEKAVRTATDIKVLNQEYRDLIANTKNPRLASEMFRQRLDVYSSQQVLEDLHKDIAIAETNVTKLISDPALLEAMKLRAELTAFGLANTEAKKNKVNIVNENEGLIATTKQLYKDLKDANPEIEEKAVANQGLINQLTPLYAAREYNKAIVQERQNKYNKTLNNPKEFEKELIKQDESQEKFNKLKKKLEAEEAAKAKEQADLNKAKEDKVKQEQKDKVKEPIITPDPASTKIPEGYRIVEEDEILPAGDYDTHMDLTTQQTITNAPKKQKPVAVDQIQSIPLVDNAYHGKTQKEVLEEETVLYDLVNSSNDINNSTYGPHNKIAYAAVEQITTIKDDSVISELYKILHSTDIGENTPVTLRPIYFEGKDYANAVKAKKGYYDYNNAEDILTADIGIYYKDTLIGKLPKKDRNLYPTLKTAVTHILEHGPTETKISKKTLGSLIKSKNNEKHLVSEAFSIVPTFAIGQNDTFNEDQNTTYKGDLVNSKQAKTGYVYAVTNTTIAGKKIALPVDVNKVSSEVADSIVAVLDIYIKANKKDKEGNVITPLTEQENKLVLEIFEKYNGLEITTNKGLQTYVNMFVHTTDLRPESEAGAANLTKIGLEEKDRFYINVSSSGIQFVQSGSLTKKGQAREVGINTTKPSDFYKDLKRHIENTYLKIDIEQLKSKKEFKAPIFKSNLEYTEYSKPTYAHHIAASTTTNIIGVRISDTEQTVFVQPTLFIDLNFAGQKPIITKIDENGKEKIATLASNKEANELTGVTRNPNMRKQSRNITQEDANEDMINCNNL